MDLRLTERHIVALNFLLVAVLAYFAALSVNDIVALRMAPATAPPPRLEARPIDNSAAHRSRGRLSGNRQSRHLQYCTATAGSTAPVVEKIDLHLTLIGVSLTTTAGKPPFAIIADRSGQQNVYQPRADGTAMPASWSKWTKDPVFIDHNGKRVAADASQR